MGGVEEESGKDERKRIGAWKGAGVPYLPKLRGRVRDTIQYSFLFKDPVSHTSLSRTERYGTQGLWENQ